MKREIRDEYYLLTEKLEEIQLGLEGKCNDIDCDKYIYKDLLKKKYKPVLKHNFSCIDSLKREKVAVLRLLSQKRFKKYRYTKCNVCKNMLDRLGNKSTIVSFTKPAKRNKGYHEWKGIWTHKKCQSKVKITKGWDKF
ncbi:hypothetical protein HYV88_06265 [Candidatus Woesearchaeota archaeon]|nr:hypothetical protein [Candidatus Woesearchaeota archaeon]